MVQWVFVGRNSQGFKPHEDPVIPDAGELEELWHAGELQWGAGQAERKETAGGLLWNASY